MDENICNNYDFPISNCSFPNPQSLKITYTDLELSHENSSNTIREAEVTSLHILCAESCAKKPLRNERAFPSSRMSLIKRIGSTG